DALQRRLQAQVVPRSEERVQRRLLQRDTDEPADLRAVLHDVVAGHERGACSWRQQRRQDVDGRRLPRAVRTEEAVDLARLDREVDSVDRAGPFLVLADEPANLDPVPGLHPGHPTHRGIQLSCSRRSRNSSPEISPRANRSARIALARACPVQRRELPRNTKEMTEAMT